MQFYIVPAFLILLGATRIRGASASANATATAKQQVLLDDYSSDSIGGSISTGNIPGSTSTTTSSNSDSNNYRRHLLPDMECVLYLKVVAFKDGHEEKSWSCEFTYEQAATFGGIEIMDIEGLTLKAIEAKGAISGETIIRVKTAYVEQFFRSNDGSSNSKTVLRIPQDSYFDVQLLDSEADPRHAQNRRVRRQRHRNRNLADSKPGTRKVLVVRVIDETGAKVNADALQLQNDIFEDAVCLKSQYAACSHDQLILEQATGPGIGTDVDGVFVNGIVDVTIDATAQDGDRDTFEQKAVEAANAIYGEGKTDLGETYDLVMFCQPPGTKNLTEVSYLTKRWVAYAHVNRWDSYYNDVSCLQVSAQMHEVGHNFNLEHSGVQGETIEAGADIADKSGMMGQSYESDDTPKMCFNAAKSFQLGWYEQQIKSINPLNFVSNPQTFILNGVADYEKDGSNGDALVALRLENEGLEGGVDYYIGYNRKIGANSGTNAAIDTVTVLEKENGINDYDTGLLGRDEYGQSWRLAARIAGGKYRIQNYGGSIYDVVVTVNSINGKEASITISTDVPVLTETPTGAPTPGVCPPTLTTFQLVVKTDKWGQETSWNIEHPDGTEYKSGTTHYPNHTYTFPSEDEYYCLQDGECYTFTIYDKFDDGICCGNGDGYYKGYLDDVEVFEGGEFGSSESKELCVPSSDTPTAPPTTPPTEATTSPGPCTNSNGTVKISKKKTTTCDNLKKGSSKKKKTACKKNVVIKACPGVCNRKCTCKDNKKFKWNDKKKYKCKNVGKDGQPKCGDEVNNNNLVEDVCPKKCDVCFS